MTINSMGTCKTHGQFVLKDGCPECILELQEEAKGRPDEPIEDPTGQEATETDLVKVAFFKKDSDEFSGREYTYRSEDRLKVGEILLVEVVYGMVRCQVTAIDVPESEVAEFKFVRTIPARLVFDGEPVSSLSAAAKAAGAEVHVVAFENIAKDLGLMPATEEPEPEPEPIEFTPLPSPKDMPGYSELPKPETAVELRPGEDLIVRGYHQEATRMLLYAEQRVIKTLDDAKMATDDLSLIQKVKKAMDDKRKEYIAPADEALKAIRATYTFLMAPILQAEKITKEKQVAFLTEQARIKREQEEINLKRVQAAEAEMRLTQELSEPVALVPEIVVPQRVRTNLGISGLTDHWTYEVIDMKLLDDLYKMINTGLLNDHARKYHDTQPLPGVRFYNKPFLSTRARKSEED